jgi:release factor glutamine methyltransferase
VTVREILKRSASWLTRKGHESSRLEAELLLAHVLDVDRVALYTDLERSLRESEIDAYRDLLRRRGDGEPVAYLTGQREFYSLTLEITQDVLVPRPETELLVDRALELGGARLLDLGTGSGCIAIALAVQLPEASVTATDLSARALEVARRNAERHEVVDRIRLLEGDLYAALPQDAGERFDLVLCNPPYVAVGGADENVARHEPDGALYGGREGLDVIRRVIAGAPEVLADDGALLMEIADDQAAAVAELAGEFFGRVEIRKDLQRLPRVLEARNSV